MVSGSTIIGIAYKDGVILAADKLGNYGSIAMHKNIDRIVKVNDKTAMAAAGDFACFQNLQKIVDSFIREDECADEVEKSYYSPREIHQLISRIFYNRRNKFDPLSNLVIVGGFDEKPFLGYVDLIGTHYEEKAIATGAGALVLPLLRNSWSPNLSFEEATKLIDNAMRVLFLRSARASRRYTKAVVDSSGLNITELIVPPENQTPYPAFINPKHDTVPITIVQ
eukprot:GCRY01002004.1.p1 GENE.GCRY01002004.1~~GCRY01002004.1.p1  ORF type:complete len:260 (+),score=32.00 GCRY01002004.1:111-782(+)